MNGICRGHLLWSAHRLFDPPVPGSRRLFEVADSLTEIKTVCACGHKATVNARIAGGRIVTEGEQVFLGGNESYVAMCYKCWQEKIKKQREEDNNR